MTGPVLARLLLFYECERKPHDFCHVKKKRSKLAGEPDAICACGCHQATGEVLLLQLFPHGWSPQYALARFCLLASIA